MHYNLDDRLGNDAYPILHDWVDKLCWSENGNSRDEVLQKYLSQNLESMRSLKILALEPKELELVGSNNHQQTDFVDGKESLKIADDFR